MAFKSYVMRDAVLVFGESETGGVAFQCQARSVTLTPDVNIQRIKTLCPDGQFADVDNPEWTLEIGYLVGEDDGETPTVEILSDYLLEHFGEKQDVYFRPRTGGPGYKVTVTIIPGGIGAEQGSFSEQSVSLPVDGQPELLASASS